MRELPAALHDSSTNRQKLYCLVEGHRKTYYGVGFALAIRHRKQGQTTAEKRTDVYWFSDAKYESVYLEIIVVNATFGKILKVTDVSLGLLVLCFRSLLTY